TRLSVNDTLRDRASARRGARGAVRPLMPILRAMSPPRPGVVTFVIAVAMTLLATSLAIGQGWETGSDGLAPIPPLRARVTDLTHTLSADEQQALEAKLAAWERDTGNQMSVLIVPSTKPKPIEDYSIRVAEALKT